MTSPTYDKLIDLSHLGRYDGQIKEWVGPNFAVVMVGETEVVGSAATLMAQHTQGMGVIDHDVGVVLLGQFHHARQWHDVAFHREDAIGNDEFHLAWIAVLEFGLKAVHVVVVAFPNLTEREATAFDDGSMVKAVQKEIVFSATERRNYAKIDLETCAEAHCGFFANQFGQLFLQSHMDVECAIQKP